MTKKALTDAQLKAQILAKAQQKAHEGPKQESMFPTEIVPLPSKGKVYPKDNPLSEGQVEIRYMTAKDEDILTNQNYLKKAIALDKLYEALVIGNGKGEAVNLDEMIMGDRSAIMLAARILGYGYDYEINVTHPQTQQEIKHTVDLRELKPKQVDESLYNNSSEFEYQLPVSKKPIKFKLATAKAFKSIERELQRQEKAGQPTKPVTTQLKSAIIEIDGETDKKFIDEFIDNYLLARDSLELRNHIMDVSPDYDLTLQVSIPEHNFDEKINLPIDVNFFWPRA